MSFVQYLIDVFCTEMKKDIAAGISDSMVDIAAFEDTSLDDGFGAAPDASITSQTGNLVHQSMIKRYIHTLVLHNLRQK